MTPTSCDTMVAVGSVTASGEVLFAKNSDRPAIECQPLVQHDRRQHAGGMRLECQFVNLPQVGATARHVGSRPYWCWGYEHGFNEHQVVIGNEALHSRLEEARVGKLIGMELLRLGLERSRTASQALEVMTDLISRYGQGRFVNAEGVRTYDNGYIVADPREAYVVETAGHEWAVRQVQDSCGISNVYSLETDWVALSPEAEEVACERGWRTSTTGKFNFGEAFSRDPRDGGSGAMRRRRSCAVLQKHRGELDATVMMALLGDHGDGENADEPFQTDISTSTSICVHRQTDGTGGNTTASLVADLCADGSRLPIYWCSMFSPCLGIFMPVFCEGVLPARLAVGGKTPTGESPWWSFHRLSSLVRNSDEGCVAQVRARWSALQEIFLADAYNKAHEGRALIDRGERQAAEHYLTMYMNNNFEQVMGTLHELIEELQTVTGVAVMS